MSSEFNCTTCNKSFATSKRQANHAKTHLIEFVVEPSSATLSLIGSATLSLIASESKKQSLSPLSKAELLEKCTELGLVKVKSKTKAELIALIEGQLVGDPVVEGKEEGSKGPKGPKECVKVNKTISPLVKWSGGKSDEIKQFAKYLPASFDTYLEPFIGGGSVYFHIAPAKAVISDVHTELIDLYQSIRDGHALEIHQFMTLNPNNEATYYQVRDKMAINCSLDNAKRFYYLRKTCFRGMLRYNKQGKFNIPFGRYDKINYSELLNPAYHQLLGATEIFKTGFEYIFENYNNPANFMFLDPPYDSEFTDYGYCQFGKEDQKRLAACFKSTKIKCLMIIGKTDFIVDLYKDYIVDSYKKNYKFKLYAGRIGSEINTEHLVIKNY
jgi:DNA adenine methylase